MYEAQPRNVPLATSLPRHLPEQGEGKSNGDSQRDFDKAMHGCAPCRALMRDEKNDADGDGCETVGAVQSEYRAQRSAEKDCRSINQDAADQAADGKVRRGQRGDDRAQSRSRKALPCNGSRVDSRFDHHDCRNRRPVKLIQLQHAGQQHGDDCRSGGACGVEQRDRRQITALKGSAGDAGERCHDDGQRVLPRVLPHAGGITSDARNGLPDVFNFCSRRAVQSQ